MLNFGTACSFRIWLLMLHDPVLLEQLSNLKAERFEGEVFRATRRSLDPLAASTSGGRWAPKGLVPVLYTSLLREGALAEISFHWSQLTPWPSRPAVIHRLGVVAERRLRLLRADLEGLDVDMKLYGQVNYHRTQAIGAAVASSIATASSFLLRAGAVKIWSCSPRTIL